MEKQQYIERLNGYKKSCLITKQINSNKANTYANLNTSLTVISIIATALLTALGFMDKSTISTLFFSNSDLLVKTKIEFIFNIAVLLVLILSILNISFNFQEKSNNHNRAVILLASLVRDIDDIVLIDSQEIFVLKANFDLFKAKYENVINLLPQHSDKAYLQAKKDLIKKDANVDKIEAK